MHRTKITEKIHSTRLNQRSLWTFNKEETSDNAHNCMALGSLLNVPPRCQTELDEDPDSRDSGISVSSSSECATHFGFSHSQGTTRKVSNNKQLHDLDEEMDYLILNEIVADFKKAESNKDSYLRQINNRNDKKNSQRVFREVTNSVTAPQESPKSHYGQRSMRLSQSLDSTRRISRHLSCFEARGTIIRKRSQNSDLFPFQKRSAISFDKNENDYSLETVVKPQIDSVAFRSISGDVIAQLMSSMSEDEFSSKFILVDCRYPYEYSGGHVKGAINMYDPSMVKQIFYPDSPTQFKRIKSKIPIFYCEYSQKRGPTMAAALRQYDRKRNEARYPEVDYKEIYLLDRGYKKFFEEDRLVHLCEPNSYVRMVASPHKEDLKRYQFHKTKSCSNFGTFRASNSEAPRRGRLNFSYSYSGSPPSRNPRRRDLFGPASPFRGSPAPATPPNQNDPIPMPEFS